MKKKIFCTALVLVFLSASTAFSQTSNSEEKILIAYYSLRNGNTRIAAEHIQKNVGGDVFRIETVQSYPSEYRAVTAQAKKEFDTGAWPDLKTQVKNFEKYNVIYLGLSNWWGIIVPAVMRFLSTYDFSGKTIIPFITHEGSRMGESEADIKKLAPKAQLLPGIAIRGRSVNDAGADVENWLRKIGKLK